MRVNKTTSLALAAALSVGGVGAATAAFAAGSSQPAAATVQAPSPLPGTGDIAAQNELLTHTAGVLNPVTELIDAVLKAPEGRLPAAAAEKHSAAVRAALGKVRKSAVAGGTVGRAAPAPAAPVDVVAKTAADLQEQVDELIKASAPAFRTAGAQAGAKTAADERPGNVKEVREELKSTVSATVDLLAAVVLSGQLPAPELDGLPERLAAPQDQDAAPSAAGLPDIAGIPG